ncbi:YqgE/AlgH family protein [Simiduia litorea]|uniref:YqgE/AlgH family protein n=1 Tax=Simiduia litorea TaxID=1435348 RepID=UPI0036F24D17
MSKSKKISRDELKAGSLKGRFLVSMPCLQDPYFNHSITYICDHSEDGAMGLVLNHPLSDINVGDIFEQLDLVTDQELANEPVFSGGPVQKERGFVLHPQGQEWDSTIAISSKVNLTASKDILASMAAGHGPSKAIVALGYAGWEAGQLEDEIANNAWITLDGDDSLLFDTPAHLRWSAAAKMLGFDLNLLSNHVGHA